MFSIGTLAGWSWCVTSSTCIFCPLGNAFCLDVSEMWVHYTLQYHSENGKSFDFCPLTVHSDLKQHPIVPRVQSESKGPISWCANAHWGAKQKSKDWAQSPSVAVRGSLRSMRMPLLISENSLQLIKILPIWIFLFNLKKSSRQNPFLLINLSLYLLCKARRTFIIYDLTALQV